MASSARLLTVLLAASLAVGCTRVPKKAEPTISPTPSTASATSPAAASAAASESSSSDTASATQSTDASSSASTSASDGPTEPGTPTGTPTAPVAASSASPEPLPSPADVEVPAEPTPLDPAADAAARILLVAGPDLGSDWVATPIAPEESTLEQGDLCGSATAGEQNRIVEVATDLTSESFEGAGRHQLSRYRPGAAPDAAQAIISALKGCLKATQDFDGQPALVLSLIHI